jgi:hypothetical protein
MTTETKYLVHYNIYEDSTDAFRGTVCIDCSEDLVTTPSRQARNLAGALLSVAPGSLTAVMSSPEMFEKHPLTADSGIHTQVIEGDNGEQEDYDDGQPSEYDEWQDYMGGDDWDHGQYD